MISLNLRQKMVLCLCLHLLFYIIVGLIFLKDLNLFNDDVELLIHAGKLSNICLEIRRYEKNFIIRHDNEDFIKVFEYINKAQDAIPQVVDELQIMPQPTHLHNFTAKLAEYFNKAQDAIPQVADELQIMPQPTYLHDFSAKLAAYQKTFRDLKEKCDSGMDITVCPLRDKIRRLGHDLVSITEDLASYEQQKMTIFIAKIKDQVLMAALFLTLLSTFTITSLYTSIIKPLKLVEKKAIDIANGTFSLLPVDEKKGEVRSVLRAFNTMVNELEDKQEQLFQAKKLSSIGTLASGTAHQINNPLNNIATSCQLALAEVDREKCPMVARMLETINQETQRAGEIVRGLLEFSRAQTFSLQPYPLAKIVNKVKLLVASEIPAGVTLETDVPEDITLYIDMQKMVEALLNLTINAIQAILEPQGTVSIGAEKDDSNKLAIITVADTGSGIDEEYLPKIFDPFFTTKNAENGTGLGLAVVYGIIKKQNGSIRVESEKGEGTRFFITLPLYSEPETTDSFC